MSRVGSHDGGVGILRNLLGGRLVHREGLLGDQTLGVQTDDRNLVVDQRKSMCRQALAYRDNRERYEVYERALLDIESRGLGR